MSGDMREVIRRDPPDWEHLLLNLDMNPLRMLAEEATQSKHRDMSSSLLRYCNFQERLGQHWFQPQLEAYRDYLFAQGGLTRDSVSRYVSRVRVAYRGLAQHPLFHDILLSLIPDDYSDQQKHKFITDFWRNINYTVSQSETFVELDAPHDTLENLLKYAQPLTRPQIDALLSAPDLTTLKGMRDRAIIATFLCTGLRVQELINLDFSDLLDDSSVQVRNRGQVDRVIPFGGLDWGLPILKAWIRTAGITSGALFISLRNDQIRFDEAGYPRRLNGLAISRILQDYPLYVEGRELIVQPHHLRYMYGAMLRAMGATQETVVQNMGYRGSGGHQVFRSDSLRRMAAKGSRAGGEDSENEDWF